jgi:hypothetical protein
MLQRMIECCNPSCGLILADHVSRNGDMCVGPNKAYDGAHDIAAQASAAWEAAVCWDDEYAIKRLAEVRAV